MKKKTIQKKKTFILKGQMVFEAEDIDDAFKKLSEHFEKLSKGKESRLCVVGTEVEIKPE